MGVPFTVGADVALGDGTNDGGRVELRGLPESDGSGVRDVAVSATTMARKPKRDALDCVLSAWGSASRLRPGKDGSKQNPHTEEDDQRSCRRHDPPPLMWSGWVLPIWRTSRRLAQLVVATHDGRWLVLRGSTGRRSADSF